MSDETTLELPVAEPVPETPVAPAPEGRKTRKPRKTTFEIGVVYRKNSRYFLAIAQNQLVTFIDGKAKVVTPSSHYDAAMTRSLSVEELCERWGISFDALDEVTRTYLAPSPSGIRSSPRGSSRRGKSETDQEWRASRTARLAC